MLESVPFKPRSAHLTILILFTAGLGGCVGGTDGPDASQQIPSITIALDTSLESADGLFEDPFLEKLRSSSKISVETYPVDSDSAKIEALRFGHVDLAVVDGASAWIGWMQHGLEVMAAEVDYQGRSYHNAHAWVRSSDPIAVAHLDGELATDPFDGAFLEWIGPLLLMEFLLLGMVLLFDCVEGVRLRRSLDDHRTAGGRSFWVLGIMLLSLGAASTVALLTGLRRGRAWQQPAVALTCVVSLPFVLIGFQAWVLSSTTSWLTPSLMTATIGVLSAVWTAAVVRGQHGLWLSASLWACHLMLYPSAMLAQSAVFVSLAAMGVSATSWMSGIFTRRKSWRVIGAVDLTVAWLLGIVALVGGASSSYILMLLVASAALLFAVTSLTQANEEALLDD